ncbi:hypothetical protein B0H65DRAFT_412003, partial [Neurospora tetraspora]
EIPALLERHRDVQPSRTRDLFVDRGYNTLKRPSMEPVELLGPEEILPTQAGLVAYQG